MDITTDAFQLPEALASITAFSASSTAVISLNAKTSFGIDPGQKNQITMVQVSSLEDVRSWNNMPAVPPTPNPRRRLRE
jgi:hypothetical protein